jgi:hypothetical protein
VKDTLQVIQLLIAVVGSLIAAFTKIADRLFPTPPSQSSSDDGNPRTARLTFEDLAIGWAAGAIIALTAGHAISIAGDSTTASFVPVLSMAGIALIVGVVVYTAWKAGRLSRSLWILSAAAILVVTLGPGGPLYPATPTIAGFAPSPLTAFEPPLPHWAALSCLVAIFIAGFSSEFPDASARGATSARAFGLVIGVIIVCIACGAALVQEMQKSPTTPSALDEQAGNWVQNVFQQLKPTDVQLLYRKSSESELIRSYRSRFFLVLHELQDSFSEDTHSTNQKDKEKSLSGDNESGAPNARHLRLEVRDLLGRSFLLSNSDRQSLIENRLQWRYPISATASKSDIAMPGIEPEDRQEVLRPYVEEYASAELARDYGVIKARDERKPGDESRTEVSRSEALYDALRNIFPSLATYSGKPRLVQQLSLPLNYESFLAFVMYQQHVAITQDLSDAVIQEMGVPADALQTLFEGVTIDPANITWITPLFDLHDCKNYAAVKGPLNQMRRIEPTLVGEGIREVLADKIDSDNSRLVDVFERINKLDSEAREHSAESQSTSNKAHDLKSPDGPDTNSAKAPSEKAKLEKLSAAEPDVRARPSQQATVFKDALVACTDKRALAALLDRGSQVGPASLLLDPYMIEFLNNLGRGGSSVANRQSRAVANLLALVSPINKALQIMGERPVAPEESDVDAKFSRFLQIEPDFQRRAALQHLAMRLYSTGGYGPSAIEAAVSQASFGGGVGFALALLLATLVVSPAFVGAVVLGRVGGRLLVDRFTLLLQAEQEGLSPTHESGVPPESPARFVGRGDIIEKLSSYARRGWNTIALVGPRGSGKSEILKSLVRSNLEKTFIGIWMQAPTSFDEATLVNGVRHRIAEMLERRISDYAGAAPWAERRLREDAYGIAARLFTVLTIMSVGVWYLAFVNVKRLDVSAIWIPGGIMGILAVSAWFLASSKLQRQDLGSWLRRSPQANPHLDLLYDMCLLQISDVSAGTTRRIRWLQLVQRVALISIPVTLIMVSAPIWNTRMLFRGIFTQQLATPTFSFETLVIAAATVVFAGAYLYRRQISQLSSNASLGTAGGVERYREFVRSCVNRLEEGALGYEKGNWRFVIAIDELDRLTRIDELRDAIIRMRGLFEIRGVFYYLSIASDSVLAFMKNDHRTKTEFDSAFDHVEELGPLKFIDSITLIGQYFEGRDVVPTAEIKRLVAILGFGIPRDLLRRADELMAYCDSNKIARPTMADVKSAFKFNGDLDTQGEPVDRWAKGTGRVDLRMNQLRGLAIAVAEKGEGVAMALVDLLIETGFEVWVGNCGEERYTVAVRKISGGI